MRVGLQLQVVLQEQGGNVNPAFPPPLSPTEPSSAHLRCAAAPAPKRVQTVTELRAKLSLADWDRICALTTARVPPVVRSCAPCSHALPDRPWRRPTDPPRTWCAVRTSGCCATSSVSLRPALVAFVWISHCPRRSFRRSTAACAAVQIDEAHAEVAVRAVLDEVRQPAIDAALKYLSGIPECSPSQLRSIRAPTPAAPCRKR
jgi:hypothetical protein